MASRWLLALPVLIAVSAGLGALSGSFEPPLPPAMNGASAPKAPAPSPPPAQRGPAPGELRDGAQGRAVEPAFAAADAPASGPRAAVTVRAST